MNLRNALISVSMFLLLCGCSTVSSSKDVAPIGPAWEGPILVTQSTIPSDVTYKVVGSVKANARAGYDSVESLYPLLANEAKNLGANAVVNVKGGRKVTLLSWAAAHVSGTAVKVENLQDLKGLPGTYH